MEKKEIIKLIKKETGLTIVNVLKINKKYAELILKGKKDKEYRKADKVVENGYTAYVSLDMSKIYLIAKVFNIAAYYPENAPNRGKVFTLVPKTDKWSIKWLRENYIKEGKAFKEYYLEKVLAWVE